MAVQASAFVGDPCVDSPVTRKQTSLFWAASKMEGRRFSRLHELLKWDLWLYEAAIKVLRLVYPCDATREKHARIIAEYLRQESCPGFAKIRTEFSDDHHFQRVKQSVMRTAIAMALEPIWRAKSGRSLRVQGASERQADTVLGLVEALEGDVLWDWVVIVRCLPGLRKLRSKSITRPLKRYISDKDWLNTVHRAVKFGVMGYLDQSQDCYSYDREFAWLLCDIALSALDEWFSGRDLRASVTKVDFGPAIENLQCHYFRSGSEVAFLVCGSMAQVRTVEQEVIVYLESELGLCGVESSICSVREAFSFCDMELFCEASAGGSRVSVRIGDTYIARYRSAVRKLTSVSRIGDYGADVVMLSINRLIREWMRGVTMRENRGVLEALDRWTETRVLRFLIRLHSNIPHKAVIRRFYGNSRESSVSDQRIRDCRKLKVEIDGGAGVLFLDKLADFQSFVTSATYVVHSSVEESYPKCAICSSVKGLRVFLSDRRKMDLFLQDFIILCGTCSRGFGYCPNQGDSGEPDAVKAARPVRRGMPEDMV